MDEMVCDLLVVGSGCAGLTAAITARALGLDVILIEKAGVVGGATAQAGGMAWVPGNRISAEAGRSDSFEAARRYIANEAGPYYNDIVTRAFLDNGPAMVDFMTRLGAVEFKSTPLPDYHPETAGASTKGRGIYPANFDGRELGRMIDILRVGNPLSTFLGVPIGRDDMQPFFTAGRSLRSALYVAKRLIAAWAQIPFHGQSMRLVAGRAMIGRLLKTATQSGVRLMLSAPVTALEVADGAVTGARIFQGDGTTRIAASRGVVLATGGFPFDRANRTRYFPGGRDDMVWVLPETNSGDGMNIAAQVGGVICEKVDSPVAYSPVAPIEDQGQPRTFSIFPTRSLPGFVAVMPDGRRFANEADSYHDFGRAIFEASEDKAEPYAYILCDHRALRRYGLGPVKPFPLPYRQHLRSGRLIRAKSIAALADQLDIDPARLEATVGRFNEAAARGEDPDFHRGENLYNQVTGDPTHRPNPNLGPLDRGPYYAMKVHPGAIATYVGLEIDGHARVLRADGTAISGLYAAGNDAVNMFGGNYVGGGSTIGPAMTFGYIAARHAAGVANGP